MLPLPSTPRVALLIETSNAYARGLLEGVTLYLNEHGPWTTFLPERGRGDALPGWLRDWKGDGILVRAENRRIARAVAGRAVPVVDLSAAGLLPGVPWVHSDARAEASAAFDHLRERGFRRLGFCGDEAYRWSRWQCEQFTRLAREAGSDCSVFPGPAALTSRNGWAEQRQQILRWVRALPRPVGIFACYDLRGQQVLDACRELGARVPDEVAVIGVDNDPVRCGLTDPPLSSVVPDTRRIGYVAAELLGQMMAGRLRTRADRAVVAGHLVPPAGVVARRSSDALAIEDLEIRSALRFIREHACEPIGVKHLLDVVPMSRRALEARFAEQVGRTPHKEILRCRIERARKLLVETELTLDQIARRVGIGTAEHMSVAFKASTGLPPAAYRKKHRM